MFVVHLYEATESEFGVYDPKTITKQQTLLEQ